MFQKVYRDFGEFERNELHQFDALYASVEEMLEEMANNEIEEEDGGNDDGILFDRLDD